MTLDHSVASYDQQESYSKHSKVLNYWGIREEERQKIQKRKIVVEKVVGFPK